MSRSLTHLVLIPSYNPGGILRATVSEALAAWSPVWVVADGSTDRSHEGLEALPGASEGLRVIVRAQNGGKGAAVRTGAEAALAAGFTHALVMDADGQHPANRIAAFMDSSAAAPGAVISGRPAFGPEAPAVRLAGRKLSVALVHFETGGRGPADPLFGFRVYPLAPLIRAMDRTRTGRRYDFDPEMAVRLAWDGVPSVDLDAACRYLDREQGGVSHFRYVRDNLGMIRLHTRLLLERWARR